MIIFIKKIKTKDGINAIDLEKIKKEIPAGYDADANEPMVSITANHVVIAYKCHVKSKPAESKKIKPKAKSKKIVVGKV